MKDNLGNKAILFGTF